MERREHPRYPRRVELRFWRRGDEHAHAAFTTNVSRTGLFLGSGAPLAPGDRLRVEVIDNERGFVVEGRVARVHRVSPALRHLEQPGFGVRFLSPAELVTELLPPGARATDLRHAMPSAGAARSAPSLPEIPPPAVASAEATSASAAPASSATSAMRAVPDAAPRSDPAPFPTVVPSLARNAPPAVERAGVAAVAASPGSAAAVVAATSPAVPEAPPVPQPPRGARQVTVPFADSSAFLPVYRRDICNGGLFVSTDAPAELNELVWVELELPLGVGSPRFPGRVVQRFDPRAVIGRGGNLLSGMAVQFLEPEKVIAALEPLVARLRS